MNGVHDMGGLEGLGAILPEPEKPIFHHPWEARALALTLAMGAWGKWNIDAGRYSREMIPGEVYLQSSYYEKWILGLCALMVEKGLVSPEELESHRPDPGTNKADPPLKADRVSVTLSKGAPYDRATTVPPCFKQGDTVRTKNINPHGHTRLPRYARAKTGVIHMHHGNFVFPDSNAHFEGEAPQHLYSVRIEARELWGEESSGRDAVYLDLWESYLEPI